MVFNAESSEEPIADLPGSLARMGGDRTLLGAVIRFFFEDYPAMLDKIRVAVGESNAHALERSAHALKGLAANFGATQVISLTAALEQMGRSGELANSLATFKKLEPAIAALKGVLEPHYLPESPAG